MRTFVSAAGNGRGDLRMTPVTDRLLRFDENRAILLQNRYSEFGISAHPVCWYGGVCDGVRQLSQGRRVEPETRVSAHR